MWLQSITPNWLIAGAFGVLLLGFTIFLVSLVYDFVRHRRWRSEDKWEDRG